MEKPQFEFYTRQNGHNEFIEFLNNLPAKDQQKLLAVISNVQEHGLLVARRMKWIKKLEDNLFELRSESGNNIQRGLYFHVKENEFVVTHGFTKKTQKTPTREITHALEIRDEFQKGGNN
ncbi:type II toxin-antitoxin system RelE/ParE family toxin [Enterococcus timonensis]|uniref:type II toxin-antitoxin system RelE/ParE family toxin n=1 Tax=Enterococcus timonensis TaxID=1852364 RepID=UPI0008D96661|nr:type II toxin-antitoxin system RelE/ParE family toxin [Enterococcus timonensis]